MIDVACKIPASHRSLGSFLQLIEIVFSLRLLQWQQIVHQLAVLTQATRWRCLANVDILNNEP